MTCPWSPSELVTDIGPNQRSPLLPASILVLKASYALPWLEWPLEKGKLGGGSAPPESGKAGWFCHFPAGSLQAARAHLCIGEPCVGWMELEWGEEGPCCCWGPTWSNSVWGWKKSSLNCRTQNSTLEVSQCSAPAWNSRFCGHHRLPGVLWHLGFLGRKQLHFSFKKIHFGDSLNGFA